MTDYQAFLLKLHQNLAILKAREAKYGGNAPLELLNQIQDHKQAITLTEQTQQSQLTDGEWRAALKPLLIAIDSRSSDAEIASSVTIGDIEGGIHDSKIAGRDIVENIFHIVNQTIPRPLLIVIGVAVVIMVVLGVANIEPVRVAMFATATPTITPIPTATPLPFAPAAENETLILIATFHHTEGVADTDTHNEIRRAIEAEVAELGETNLRVEVEPTRLVGDDQDTARKLGERYRASMIIWGSDTGVRVTVNFLNLKDPDYGAGKVKIDETKRTQFANPSAYARFITEDLPGQITFLALYAVGRSYFIGAEYPRAIPVMEKAMTTLALQVTPTVGIAEAYFLLGSLYYLQIQYNQAIANFNKAIEFNYDLPTLIYNDLGLVYHGQNDYQRAIANYTKSIKLDPKFPFPYNNRGLVYFNQGDYEQAIIDFNAAIKLDPQYALAYNNRGKTYSVKGDYQRAIGDFWKAIELDSEMIDAYNNLGLVYNTLGDYQAAIADFDIVVEIDQNNSVGYYNRGLAYYNQGEYEEAITNFNKAIALNPKDVFAFNNRGNIYHRQRDYEQAIVDYTKAIELDPELAEAYYNRGNVYRDQGDYQQAIGDYVKAVELNPNDVDFQKNLCRIGSLMGFAAEFMGACEQAVQLAPNDATNRDNRGLVRALIGDYKGAIKDFNFVVEWMKQNGLYESHGRKREAWIAELKAGRNPFDEATLEELRKE